MDPVHLGQGSVRTVRLSAQNSSFHVALGSSSTWMPVGGLLPSILQGIQLLGLQSAAADPSAASTCSTNAFRSRRWWVLFKHRGPCSATACSDSGASNPEPLEPRFTGPGSIDGYQLSYEAQGTSVSERLQRARRGRRNSDTPHPLGSHPSSTVWGSKGSCIDSGCTYLALWATLLLCLYFPGKLRALPVAMRWLHYSGADLRGKSLRAHLPSSGAAEGHPA